MKEPPNEIWPPPPKRPEPEPACAPVYVGEYLTGRNWLDAVLGVPAGFLIGAILWGIALYLIQAVRGLPSHQRDMEAACVLGFLLTVAAYVLVGRKYSLFGFTMIIGGFPFYFVVYALTALISQ